MSVSKQQDSPILNAFKQRLCSSHNGDIDDNVPVYKPDDDDTDDTSLLFLSQSLASPISIKTVIPGKDIKPSKDKYCIPTCSRKQHTNMIRCCTCMQLFHCTCVGEKNDNRFWNCFSCRNISSLIMKMFDELLLARQNIAKWSCENENSKQTIHLMKAEMESINKKLSCLQTENLELKEKIGTMLIENRELKAELSNQQDPSLQQKASKEPLVSSLLIGDSLIRDIKPEDKTLSISCISGANLDLINEHVTKCESENKQYENVYIVAGTNDCSSSEKSTEEILNSASNLIQNAKKISKSIKFSSVPPRTDSGSAQLKLENFNLSLKVLCDETHSVTFVDNDGTFKVADGSTNDALLHQDGLHLSFKGAQKLISNLSLKGFCTVRSSIGAMSKKKMLITKS